MAAEERKNSRVAGVNSRRNCSEVGAESWRNSCGRRSGRVGISAGWRRNEAASECGVGGVSLISVAS
jgi:hypothetical protein